MGAEMSQPTGGPAFPRAGNEYTSSEEGMTLRDYFAAMALQGILAAMPFTEPGETCVEEVVNGKRGGLLESRAAYRYADAMLKQREAQS